MPGGFAKEKLKTILIDYYDRIRDKNAIRLYDDIPVTSKPRTVPYVPYAYQSEICKQLDELLEKVIIEHSDSPYSSPITSVKKRDGTIRLCCHFRKLNAKTIPKSFRIPKAENKVNVKCLLMTLLCFLWLMILILQRVILMRT